MSVEFCSSILKIFPVILVGLRSSLLKRAKLSYCCLKDIETTYFASPSPTTKLNGFHLTYFQVSIG